MKSISGSLEADALRAGLTKYLQKQEKIENATYDCLDVNRKRFTFNELSLTLEVQR